MYDQRMPRKTEAAAPGRPRPEEARLAPAPADTRFELVSDFEARGDQPRAIDELTAGIERGEKHQVLLGVTGSGKTFTVASMLARVNRPALVLAHNKTLAAQLYQEFKTFFPGTRSSTSSPTTTTTSPRPTSPSRTPTSRRKRRSTTRSTACASRPPAACSSGATW